MDILGKGMQRSMKESTFIQKVVKITRSPEKETQDKYAVENALGDKYRLLCGPERQTINS